MSSSSVLGALADGLRGPLSIDRVLDGAREPQLDPEKSAHAVWDAFLDAVNENDRLWNRLCLALGTTTASCDRSRAGTEALKVLLGSHTKELSKRIRQDAALIGDLENALSTRVDMSRLVPVLIGRTEPTYFVPRDCMSSFGSALAECRRVLGSVDGEVSALDLDGGWSAIRNDGELAQALQAERRLVFHGPASVPSAAALAGRIDGSGRRFHGVHRRGSEFVYSLPLEPEGFESDGYSTAAEAARERDRAVTSLVGLGGLLNFVDVFLDSDVLRGNIGAIIGRPVSPTIIARLRRGCANEAQISLPEDRGLVSSSASSASRVRFSKGRRAKSEEDDGDYEDFEDVRHHRGSKPHKTRTYFEDEDEEDEEDEDEEEEEEIPLRSDGRPARRSKPVRTFSPSDDKTADAETVAAQETFFASPPRTSRRSSGHTKLSPQQVLMTPGTEARAEAMAVDTLASALGSSKPYARSDSQTTMSAAATDTNHTEAVESPLVVPPTRTKTARHPLSASGSEEMVDPESVLDDVDRSADKPRRKVLKTSQFRGVRFCKRSRKWIASICFRKHTQRLGVFAEEEEAARAYDRAAWNIIQENPDVPPKNRPKPNFNLDGSRIPYDKSKRRGALIVQDVTAFVKQLPAKRSRSRRSKRDQDDDDMDEDDDQSNFDQDEYAPPKRRSTRKN